ncbi:hypothetical protein [Paucibacter sp. DJ2R-2]|uniref:hypothetical protein n=1 Tax=unclassified Roseateles TaxID=2626991 RepID=UPI0021E43706|nr:hypothetical protein [Paucibacter sp. DJ2R-2]MCV2438590.1 hypothetical protein [Paucibacter sp. DJ2R-2]
MWVIWVREPEPEPDAAYWPGRRLLAALDAVLWPGLWMVGSRSLPPASGDLWLMVCGFAFLSLCSRLHRAVAMNGRYRFTTWLVAKLLFAMALVGCLIRCSAPG